MCFFFFFFFSSRRRHTRCLSDWSSDVCSSDLSFDVCLGPRNKLRLSGSAILPSSTLGLETWSVDEPGARSEERRVGKECRCRWSPYHEKKKEERGVRRRKVDANSTV